MVNRGNVDHFLNRGNVGVGWGFLFFVQVSDGRPGTPSHSASIVLGRVVVACVGVHGSWLAGVITGVGESESIVASGRSRAHADSDPPT